MRCSVLLQKGRRERQQFIGVGDGETFLARPDAWWLKAGVVVEVDSREWHLSPEDWRRIRTPIM